MFGQGDYPLNSQIRKIKKINIVMDNLTPLVHVEELKKKLDLHRNLQAKEGRKFDLEFYTLDLQNEKLITLQAVIEKLRDLKRKMGRRPTAKCLNTFRYL